MKQTIKIVTFALFAAVFVLLQSCNEGDDPLMSRAKVEMKATASESTINGRTASSGFVFHEVMLGVRELEIESSGDAEAESEVETKHDDDCDKNDDDGDDHENEIEFEGEFVVDLIAGTSHPDFGMVDIAPGLYNEIKIETGNFLEGGYSMFVVFEYTPEGASEPVMVEYSSAAEIELKIERHSGFRFTEGNLSNILVQINLDDLFAGIDPDGAAPDDDGVIRINDSLNAEIAAEVNANLFGSVTAAGTATIK